MENFKRRLGAVAVAAALALPGTAFAQEYYCTLSSQTDGWVPREFSISYIGSNAVVSHGWGNSVESHQVPIRGNNTQRRVSYSIQTSGFGANQATIAFRLTHNVATGGLRVRLNPIEYPNTASGIGACVPV